MSAPLQYVWANGCWTPLPYFRRQAEREFGEGEVRELDAVQERSQASHNQFFAWIADIFNNLPEPYQGRWTTPDDLRKWVLTFTKFCDREEFRCSTHAEAVRWANFLGTKYDRLEIEGNTLVGYTAHSQAKRAMSKRAFQESKDAVGQACAQILGVDVETARREAGRAA